MADAIQPVRSGPLLIILVGIAMLAAWMNVVSGKDVIACERLIKAEFADAEAYFRTGFRFSVSQYAPGERVLYVSFTRPRHGLATCRLEKMANGYRIVAHEIEWGSAGAPPRSLP